MIRFFISVAVLFLWAPCSSVGQQMPSSPREQLKQYVADLQKNPSDDALREKIIKLVATLDPRPAIPEEARRHFVRADTLAHDVHAPGDVPPAVEEYQQALAIAPWWSDVYHDLAVILGTGQRWHEARRNLRFYLLTVPGEKEARAAQDEIYKIEAKEEEAAAQAETEQAKAREDARAQAEREAARRLEGRYIAHQHREGGSGRGKWWSDQEDILDIRDGQVVEGGILTRSDGNNIPYQQHWTARLNGRKFHLDDKYGGLDGIISEDATSVTITSRPNPMYPGDTGSTQVFHRQ